MLHVTGVRLLLVLLSWHAKTRRLQRRALAQAGQEGLQVLQQDQQLRLGCCVRQAPAATGEGLRQRSR
jgi:hypothetical protein